MATAGGSNLDHGDRNSQKSDMDEAAVRLLVQSESHKLLGENDSPTGGEVEISQSETVLDMSALKAAEQCVPHIGHMGKDECVAHISTLHDDVEKMFVKAPKFDVAQLSSDPVVSDPRGFGEEDFRSHRQMTFPHVHHPLKALRSHAVKKSRPLKGMKSKKKKKRKLKTVRNFPSKTAAQIPSIPEEKEDNEEDDSEDSEDSSEDDDEEELNIPEEEILRIRQEEDEVDYKETAAPMDKPSSTQGPISSRQPGSPIAIPGMSVGFYIGDEHAAESPGSPPPDMSQKPSDISAGSLFSAGSGVSVKPGDPEETPSRKGSTLSVEASKFRKQSSAEPVTTPMFADIEDEPLLSQQAGQVNREGNYDPGRKGSILSVGSTGSSGKVTFLLGNPSDIDLTSSGSPTKVSDKENMPPKSSGHSDHSGYPPTKSKSKHRHHHHHDQFKMEDLLIRRQPGSEIQLDTLLRRVPTEVDEASMLQKADLDDMASHRWEDVRGIRRHKIQKHGALTAVSYPSKKEKDKKKFLKFKKKFDHTPHEVFVELDVLHSDASNWQWEWREKARWIKFEEDVEEGAERWGKPHVASLSFHSLLELRKLLESGTLLLDLEAKDLPSIFHSVVENMIINDQISDENRGNVLRTLLLKHKHVSERNAFIRRNISYLNLMGLEHTDRRHQKDSSVIKNFSTASFGSMALSSREKDKDKDLHSVESGQKLPERGEYMKLELMKTDIDNEANSDGVHIGFTLPEAHPEEKTKQAVQEIMKRIPKDSEAAAVLVGTVDFLTSPTMAVVRLSEGQVLNLTEVPLPVRFIFVLLGPPMAMDYHEVGRSLSTLMSNQHFHGVAYKADSREELLHAINEFLDESIVLPPGDWDRKTLLPIMDMARRRATVKRKKKQKQDEKMLDGRDGKKPPIDPLKRTGVPFGGLINDIKRRYPHYLSDFQDALNPQCLAAFIFIFFACLSPSIAFGGLMGEKTEGYIGVSETILATSIAGVFFGLLSGQPIMIIGYTGPVLLFEETLFNFCLANDLEYLAMRFWVGMWLFLICMVVVATEASFLVRYITRFTEEIFATLISLLFIYEVFNKLSVIFANHPLTEEYCFSEGDNSSVPLNSSLPNGWNYSYPAIGGNASDLNDTAESILLTESTKVRNQPNTALLSFILCLGTFLIAYFLRIFRNSKFLGRSVRRALGDFGVVIAILIMVLVDFAIFTDTYTQKLEIPEGLSPTSPDKRGWVVNPMGDKKPIQIWQIFAASVGALLVFVLIFMESQITQMILNKKDRKLQKGSGYHLDMFLIGIIAGVNSIFGMPWLCAATVRSMTHVSALTVMSRTHAPGEKPKLLMVMEQRLTNILVNVFVGLSLAMGSILREIPMAVLFGVFLYMGVSSLSGVQLFERVKLLLMPVKHHPSVGYVRRVRTLKMNIFTLIQVGCLGVLWVVKSTMVALAFPFILIILVPLRLKLFKYIFTEKELHELDKEEEDNEEDEEDEPDFYQMAHMPM